jgi:predicted metalloprotease
MRWGSGRRSDNIEDRRGRSAGGGLKIGGGIGLLVLLGSVFLGKDLSGIAALLETLTGQTSVQTGDGPLGPASANRGASENELADFVSVILADTEDTWAALFQQEGKRYVPPKLVLFTDSVQSACGLNSAAVGPFYCPPDQKVYIDLSFYQELKNKLGAPGDFAQAYVIAHEIGHHVQTLLGVSERTRAAKSAAGQNERNQLSVKQELQADCLAGVWGHHADKQRQMLEQGDLEEAIIAAAAIGDDQLQKQAGGAVSPESWTHGSSAQRVKWFRVGMRDGKVAACDTFAGRDL